jgi:hypothetical protein
MKNGTGIRMSHQSYIYIYKYMNIHIYMSTDGSIFGLMKKETRRILLWYPGCIEGISSIPN